MNLATVIRGERFVFPGLREVFAAASEEKSGDQLAGIAAATERQRVAAKRVLAEVTLREVVDHPLVDPDHDEVTRLVLDQLDEKVLGPLAHLTVGGFRDWILDDATTGAELAEARAGLTPEIVAAVTKLMSNKDLVLAASKMRVVTRCRNTMGQGGVLGIRIQPNHPSDDLAGILLSAADGLVYGCGDAVIGVNPAAESVAVVGSILRGLNRLIEVLEIPTQACCLAHITTQLACLEAGAPIDLLFQSIAGTEAANRSFGIDLALLREGRERVLEHHHARDVPWAGDQVMYFETGQGSALSAAAHHGVDQLTLEARAYAVARAFDPFLVNSVVGFIGPEYLFDERQIIRAGLEDHFMGKLLGLPMGVDVCYTNHAAADQNSADNLLVLLTVAGCNYFMGVPCSDDVMLNYQSTSYHDAVAMRRLFGLRPAPEFADWLEERGTSRESWAMVTGPARKQFLHKLELMLETTEKRRGMTKAADCDLAIDDDLGRLQAMGYAQELARKLSGFSNFAMSLSIICILAGGVTSFHLGLCSAGGASIGLVWPLVSLFALVVAATMGQLASTFPTAGGLYHWSSILGGRGWGWATAWFNLAGLVTVLAAINVGTYRFALGALGASSGSLSSWNDYMLQAAGLIVMTGSQAVINHLGIGITARLTDFSGYLILVVASLLAICLLAFAPSFDVSRLAELSNFSGEPGGGIWPRTESLGLVLALGALLPAYTITGFDASAHASEETLGAAHTVPRGIVRSVLVSGIAGWIFLSAVILAAPGLAAAASHGEGAFLWIIRSVLPGRLAAVLIAGIVVAQYLCGLATVTSASRMAYAFARDGGIPFSGTVRWVCPRRRSPVVAVWMVAAAAVAFTLYTPVYSTITAVCTIFLYLSYVIPIVLGARAHGRTWTAMGPWNLGRWFRPLAWLSAAGCLALAGIGMQPPNERSIWVVGGVALLLAAVWIGGERYRFPGPPHLLEIGMGTSRPHQETPGDDCEVARDEP